MIDLINLLLLLAIESGALPATTPQDIFNYVEKENSNARHCQPIPISRDAAEHYGTQPSTIDCTSRDAAASAKDSHSR